MKYHKIRGVDKSTCTAEQKIAYNMAWYIWNDCRYDWTACRTRIDWSEQENDAIRDYIDHWQRATMQKKTKDVILTASFAPCVQVCTTT